jgi:ABC-type transporter Mla MlaB component
MGMEEFLKMFRIIRKDHKRHILITIEGLLTSDFVETAESTCNEALQTHMPIEVFLKDIVEMDSGGRAFLERLLMKKARLRAVGVYCRYIVRKLQSRIELRD